MNLIREIYKEIVVLFEKIKKLDKNDISTDVHKCNLLSYLYFVQSITLTEYEFYRMTGVEIKDLNNMIHSFSLLYHPNIRYMDIGTIESMINTLYE